MERTLTFDSVDALHQEIIRRAKLLLADKNIHVICLDRLKDYRQYERITDDYIAQAARDLRDDTMVWEGYFHGVPNRR